MTFTGDTIDAILALEWGFVSRVVPGDELLSVSHELASRISRNPPQQPRIAKRLMREGMSLSLESILEMSAAF